MTHPQVLSDERMSEVLSTAYGSPEWTMDDVRAARAIESATLEAVRGQAFGFVWRQKGSEDQWRFCQDVTQAADAEALSNTEIQLVYTHASPTQPPAQAERAPVDELIEALEDLMDWQVKNVKSWHNRAYDRAHFVIEKHRAALQSPPPAALKGQP